ncbi:MULTISPECIES: hypothetical protein [Cyanophyceae]|uniref:hypothetical protein n=1 Tax=Cyanophyceae TaxID=3028117 RepID=UPI0018F012A2|nr:MULTISPECIES: hypothetical protein [unclassified Trichocoleus]
MNDELKKTSFCLLQPSTPFNWFASRGEGKNFYCWGLGGIAFCFLPFAFCLPAWALPPPEEVPEEVLRTEIITEARSPIDGKPITAAEYAQLQAELQTITPGASPLNPQLRELVFLLRVRQLLRGIGVPIK